LRRYPAGVSTPGNKAAKSPEDWLLSPTEPQRREDAAQPDDQTQVFHSEQRQPTPPADKDAWLVDQGGETD
jgi:hypothetical protein